MRDSCFLQGGRVLVCLPAAVQADCCCLCCVSDTRQVGSYGDPGRDPRGWTVTVAYAAVVPSTELGVKAAVSAQGAELGGAILYCFSGQWVVARKLWRSRGRGDRVGKGRGGVVRLQRMWLALSSQTDGALCAAAG